MKTNEDVPSSYRKALAGIDYTSPVCKINVAVNKIPNFLANPNSGPNTVMPHHMATILLNCEHTHMIEQAYQVKRENIFKSCEYKCQHVRMQRMVSTPEPR